MPPLLTLIGILVVLAGLHLLWQTRHGFFFWLETYSKIFLSVLRQAGKPVSPVRPARERQSTLGMILGIGLAFVIGPALIVLGLTL